MSKDAGRRARLLAFVGRSGTGKTTLLRKLAAALRRRGRTVAVVKHCGHGFDLGGPDKDSSLLLKAGASSVALVGPGRMAVLVPFRGRRPSDRAVAALLGKVDFVLVEGGQADADVPKIEVLRRGVAEEVRSRPGELVAVVADFLPREAGCPVFRPGRIRDLADFVDELGRPIRPRARSGRDRER
jgi:molybdopterin-guanine dinucleotide biosynthesis protein MobB